MDVSLAKFPMFFDSYAAQESVAHQEFLAPYRHPKTAAGFASSVFFYYRQNDVEPIHGDIRQTCTRNSCIVKTVLASLLAIVLPVTLCNSAQRKKQLSAFLQRRKLSDFSDSLSEELLLCAETDEETDSASDPNEETLTASSGDEKINTAEFRGGLAAPSSVDEADSSAKRPRLEPEPSGESLGSPAGSSPIALAGTEEEAKMALQGMAERSPPGAAEASAELQQEPLDLSFTPRENAGDSVFPSRTSPQQKTHAFRTSPQLTPSDLSVHAGVAAGLVDLSSSLHVLQARSPAASPLTGSKACTADELLPAHGLVLLQPTPPAVGPTFFMRSR